MKMKLYTWFIKQLFQINYEIHVQKKTPPPPKKNPTILKIYKNSSEYHIQSIKY